MDNGITNLTGAMEGVFQGYGKGSILNCCKVLNFNNVVFVKDSYINYNIYNGIFNTKLAGIYNLKMPIIFTSLSDNDVNIKVVFSSLKSGTIGTVENIIKANSTFNTELIVYFKAKSYDVYKINVLLSNKSYISYEGDLYISYSLN